MNDADANPPTSVFHKNFAGPIVAEAAKRLALDLAARQPSSESPEHLDQPDSDPPDVDPESPTPAQPTSVNHTAGDSIHAERDAYSLKITIADSTALADLQDLLGTATNRESVEVEVEALLTPPEHEAHFEALEEHRLLVLTATRRTGLSTAAKQRCKAFAEARGSTARRLRATSEDELRKELGGIDAPTVLMLDASRNPALTAILPSFIDRHRDTFKNKDCHLVLAVEHQARHKFSEQFQDSVFALERIDPHKIFDRHFRRARTELRQIHRSDYFEDTLRTAWPPLARLMAELLNDAPADLRIDVFREQLRYRLGDASETIRDLLEHQLDPQGKAVLMSAAALELLPPSAIALAADDLLRESRDEAPPAELFRELGIDQKVELIRQDFNLKGSNFKNPGLGDEVLLHVWDQYPTWREPLARWLNDLLLGPGYIEWTETTRLPRRLVMLASSAGNGSMLTVQAATMLASRSSVIRSFAPVVLLAGAIDDTIGPGIRNQLYEWSRSTDPEQQWAALAACSHKEYLVRYPSNALFRLRRLTGSPHGDIQDAAFAAIVDSSEYLHLSDLLIHFHFWLIGSRPGDVSMIPQLLDQICGKPATFAGLRKDPGRLLDDHFGLTEAFWKLLLAIADPASARLAVRAWLSVATEIAPDHGDRMVELLVNAAATDYGAIGQIAQAAKSLMLDGSGLPERTRELSRHMLNRVFEIEVPLP